MTCSAKSAHVSMTGTSDTGTDGRMSRLAPILVVDDDDGIRGSICDALALTGYPVVTADHGGIALEIVEHQPVALILLDMNMPVMDGWAFVREYRAAFTRCAPIVVLT